MDDIVIFSKTREEHIQKVDEVMQTLGKFGLRINMKKCFFCKNELKFLGFVVDGQTVKIDKDRFYGLNDHIKANTVKRLQRALGF